MAVSLSAKRREAKIITVKWGEDDVDLSYYPNAVTPALLDKIDEAAEKDDNNAIGSLMEAVVEWWDVLDDDGKRYPTDAASIASLPLRWLLVVQKGIGEDQDPPESGN